MIIQSSNRIYLPFMAFAILMFSTLVSAQATVPAETLKELEGVFDKGCEQAKIVGGSLVVVHNSNVIFEKHFGLADKTAGKPVTRNSIYNWASISKAVTAIAVMQLHERGRLSIDDPIVKYLPDFKQVHSEYGPIEKVTIRHMLTHTSGYQSPKWPWRDKDKSWQPFAITRWSQFAARWPYAEILFEPGSKIRYSNAGHMFVARIIEVVTGEKFEMYVDKNIFSPLEMHSSFFNKTPYHLLALRSHSYSTKDSEFKESRFDFDTGIQAANGGWNGSIADMINFLKFIIGKPEHEAQRDIYQIVLTRKTLESMWQPHYKFKRNFPFTEFGENESNALGITFFLEENFGIKAISHAGGQEDFSTYFYYDTERDIAYASAFNSIVYEKMDGENYVPKATFFLELAIRDFIFQHIFKPLEKVRDSGDFAKAEDYYRSRVSGKDN